MKTIKKTVNELLIMPEKPTGITAELFIEVNKAKMKLDEKGNPTSEIEKEWKEKEIICRIVEPETVEEFNAVMEFAKNIFKNEDSILPKIYGSIATEENKNNFIDGIMSIFAKMEILKDVEAVQEKTSAETETKLRMANMQIQNLNESLLKMQKAIVLGSLNQVDLEEYKNLKQRANTQQQKLQADQQKMKAVKETPKTAK